MDKAPEDKPHVVMLADGSLFQYGTNKQTSMGGTQPVEWLGKQLSGIRRFQGATTHGISVAAHSLLAYETARSYLGMNPSTEPTDPNVIEALLAALLHDARECATGDISGPFLNYWRAKHPESYASILETESTRFEMTLLMFLDLPLDLFEKNKMLVGYVDKQTMLMETAFMPVSKHFKFPAPDDPNSICDANETAEITRTGEDAYQFTRILTDLLQAYRRATKVIVPPLPTRVNLRVIENAEHEIASLGGRTCTACGSKVYAYLCNDLKGIQGFGEEVADIWWLCENADCEHANGEGTGDQDPKWTADPVLAAELAKPAAKKFRASYLSRTELFKLHNAVREIYAAYGRHNNYGVYLVGSCLERADYRDVDVRCILGDDAFENLFPKDSNGQRPLWRLTCISLSTWLAEVTGLPIDFQFQKQTVANAKHRGRRNGLGTYHWSGDGAD